MIVDMDKLIARQLACQGPETVVFDSAHSTGLTPVRQTPVPLGTVVSLDGLWKAVYRKGGRTALIDMPGKVFYGDPEAEKGEIPNFDRVKLQHIDATDGARLSRTVEIPAAWAGKRIFLRFDAIYPGGDVYVQGRKLLEVRSGLTPSDVEITDLVTPGGTVEVAVDLIRRHKFIQLDMPRHALEYAGLPQPACLFAVDPAHITGHFLVPSLNADFTAGALSGEVTLSGPAPLAVAVFDGDVQVATAEYPAADRHQVRLALRSPKLWNDEFPNLYSVRLTVGDGSCYEFKTGFRRLEFTNGVPTLNGRFVKFRGVNHLTFHPEHGLYTPKDWLRRNLELMKKANVNCIRTHFTGPAALQELCDELGFYLLQEIPIDWGTNFIHDPEWMGPILHRVESVIRRDRHHPSLMVWSVGNENMPESKAASADGWNHLAGLDRFCHQLDPTRPTMFPPPGPANAIKGIFELRVGDIADTHYNFALAMEFMKSDRIANPRSWEADMETTTRAEALARGWSGAFFSSEWGIYNLIPDLLNNPAGNIIATYKGPGPMSGASTTQVFQDRLAVEWGFLRSEPTCLGGAFFPWMSASAGRENPWGWMRFGEDCDWGVVCADFTVKPEFWAMRRAFSPVQLPVRLAWRKGQEQLEFRVQNQFNAIDLTDCVFRAQIAHAGETAMRKFFDLSVTGAPGEQARVRVPLTADQRNLLDAGHALVLRLTLLRPDGFKFLVNETFIVPETESAAPAADLPLTIGPDAVMENR